MGLCPVRQPSCFYKPFLPSFTMRAQLRPVLSGLTLKLSPMSLILWAYRLYIKPQQSYSPILQVRKLRLKQRLSLTQDQLANGRVNSHSQPCDISFPEDSCSLGLCRAEELGLKGREHPLIWVQHEDTYYLFSWSCSRTRAEFRSLVSR